jgi:hypothetical protein
MMRLQSFIEKSPFACSVLLATLYVSLIQVSIGSYFEDYEVLIHQFILGNGSGRPYKVWVTDMDFGLIPIYAYLQKLLPGISMYSLFKTVFLILAISVVVWVIIKHFKNGFRAWILLLAALLLMDDVVWINNVRLSSWLALAALLLLFFRHLLPPFPRYLLFSGFLLLAVLNRIEIPLVYITLAMIPAFLAKRRDLLAPLMLAWTLCAGNLVLYDRLMHLQHPRIVNFHNFERALYDRADFVLGDLARYPAALDSTQLSFLAQMLFLHDEEKLDYSEFSKIVHHETALSYLISNSRLLMVWWEKNEALLVNMALNYWPKALVILLAFTLIFLSRTVSGVRLLTTAALLIVAPMALNLLYITPDRFISPYLNMTALVAVLYLAIQLRHRPVRFSMAAFMLLLPLLMHWHIRVNGHYKVLQEREQHTLKMMERFGADNQLRKPPVLYTTKTMDVLPARLFQVNAGANWYFLDANIFNYYEHSGEHNAGFFGDKYPSFAGRVSFLCDQELPLYADESSASFIINYLAKVHHMKVALIKEQVFPFSGSSQYRIICEVEASSH